MQKLKIIFSILLGMSISYSAFSETPEYDGLQVPISKNSDYLSNSVSQQVIEQKNSAVRTLNNERQRYEWMISRMNSQVQNLKEYLKSTQESMQKIKIELDLQRKKNEQITVSLQSQKKINNDLTATASSLKSQISLRNEAIEELVLYIENGGNSPNYQVESTVQPVN